MSVLRVFKNYTTAAAAVPASACPAPPAPQSQQRQGTAEPGSTPRSADRGHTLPGAAKEAATRGSGSCGTSHHLEAARAPRDCSPLGWAPCEDHHRGHDCLALAPSQTHRVACS